MAIDTATDEPIVSDIIKTIKTDQNSEGAFTWNGWAGVDMTGAAVNALKYADQKGLEISQKIFTDAKNYLKLNQQEDGGWGWGCEEQVNVCKKSDVINTTWVLMGINSLDEGQNEAIAWLEEKGISNWKDLNFIWGGGKRL